MPEHAHGWPFLVARGRHKGYRSVLAPDFLTERRMQGVLSDSVGVGNGGWDEPHLIEIRDTELGPLTVVYRIEVLGSADLNGGETSQAEAITDEHGRPLELLYGVVSRERLSGQVADSDIRRARDEAMHSYRRFLAQEDAFGVDASRGFPLQGVGVATVPPLRHGEQPQDRPPPVAPRWPGLRGAPPPGRAGSRPHITATPMLLAGVTVTLLLALIVWWSRPGPFSDRVEVSVATVQPQTAVDCRAPVALKGTIAADKAATVTYRWQTPAGAQPSQKLRLADAAPHQVELSLTASPAIRAGSYVLVVDKPDKQRAAIRLACR